MADDTTQREKLDEAVDAALVPNGPAVKDRGDEGSIHVGETEVADFEVELVDAGYDVPEVHVSKLDKRHPDPDVGVVVPAEGMGSLELPINAFLDARRPEDVFAEASADEDDEEPAPAKPAAKPSKSDDKS